MFDERRSNLFTCVRDNSHVTMRRESDFINFIFKIVKIEKMDKFRNLFLKSDFEKNAKYIKFKDSLNICI